MRLTNTWLAIGLILAASHVDAAATPHAPDRAVAHLLSDCECWQSGATPKAATRRSEMWWRDDDALIELGIGKRRSEELEAIFQQTLPMLRTEGADVVRKEDVLRQLLANASTTNESAVVHAVEELEAARRSFARTFTMMQYYMYRRLTSSQRAKVHEYLHRETGKATSVATPR